MGLRDLLRQSLRPELHGCTPYTVQPCNVDPGTATGSATGTQPDGSFPVESRATGDATRMQSARCATDPTPDPLEQDQREAFIERAAIREFDGGASRVQAERGASVDFLRLSGRQADECHAGGWSDAEIEAFQKRRAAFAARGFAGDEADAIAEALTLRDRDGDDRRLCLECSYLGERGRCIAAMVGRLRGADRHLEPMQAILQRCEAFGLRKGLP